jgi:hypothetical protein
MARDPGGENEIVMFKSCFPNSDLYGNPNDDPASEPNDEFTVSNAKAVYNKLLTYFRTRQDKLFIVITAPPMAQSEYQPGDQTPAERAANARAFNNWLMDEQNGWLKDYPYNNVAVFDYYNVLTSNGSTTRIDDPGTTEEPNDAGVADGNHHRWRNSTVEHIQTISNNYSAYPSGDSHPSSNGHQKATAEFVPLLNIFYHRWQASLAQPDFSSSTKQANRTIAVTGDTLTFTLRHVWHLHRHGCSHPHVVGRPQPHTSGHDYVRRHDQHNPRPVHRQYGRHCCARVPRHCLYSHSRCQWVSSLYSGGNAQLFTDVE